MTNLLFRAGILTVATLLTACVAVVPSNPDIYEAMSVEDIRLAAEAQQQALETQPDGETAAWNNPITGHGGSFTPISTWIADDGHYCRDYQEQVVTRAGDGRFLHQACRSETGAWVWQAP